MCVRLAGLAALVWLAFAFRGPNGQRIIALDDSGRPGTIVEVPHQICGHTIVNGCFYCVTTDDETSGQYYLTRVDARTSSPVSVDLASIAFNARGLAFDGERFWTNDREIHQTVAFAPRLPGEGKAVCFQLGGREVNPPIAAFLHALFGFESHLRK